MAFDRSEIKGLFTYLLTVTVNGLANIKCAYMSHTSDCVIYNTAGHEI